MKKTKSILLICVTLLLLAVFAYLSPLFYYENNPQNKKGITVDAKNQKRIDLSKIDSKFDYTTYDGAPCICRWISETELLITCYDGEEEYIQTVINVEGNEK